MSESTDEPASARGLADILREAGISAAGAGGRRRRRDDAQAASDAETDPSEPSLLDRTDEPPDQNLGADIGGLSAYFLARSEVPHEQTAPHLKPPSLRPPDVKGPHVKAPEATDIASALMPPPRTDTGPLPTKGWSSPGSPRTNRGAESTSTSGTTGTSHANRSPSPVATTPPVDADVSEAAAPLRGGAASWAILAVELLAAAGLGVAAWYAFSAVWELLPYVAAFLGPLVVTGLVAVAGALRARTGRNPLGLPTLCILVFAGTVLVVLPAATVIIP